MPWLYPQSEMDMNQILQLVFDEQKQRLRVAIDATIVAGAVEVQIDDTTDSIAIGDGSGTLATFTTVGPKNGLDVNVIQSHPVKLQDGAGNNVTSQSNGVQQALDVGINVAGAQVDPRQIRQLTNIDVVTSQIQDGFGNAITSQINGTQRTLDVGVNVAGVQIDPRQIRTLTATDEVTIRPTGLRGGFRVTTMTIGDTATKIPTTAFSGANTLGVHNKSTSDVLYIGPANTVTASDVDGGFGGWEIMPRSVLNIDLKDIVDVYAIAETGKTIKIKILEAS